MPRKVVKGQLSDSLRLEYWLGQSNRSAHSPEINREIQGVRQPVIVGLDNVPHITTNLEGCLGETRKGS